jgi:hypothetical protein
MVSLPPQILEQIIGRIGGPPSVASILGERGMPPIIAAPAALNPPRRRPSILAPGGIAGPLGDETTPIGLPARQGPSLESPPIPHIGAQSPFASFASGVARTTAPPSQQAGGTFLGLDRPTIANFLSEWAAGVGSIPQGSGPIGAFAAGLGGALNAEQARAQREEAARLAREEKEFERGFKTREEKRAEEKERREAEKAKLENLKTAAEIQSEIRKNEGKLSPTQLIQLNQVIFGEIRSLRDSGAFTEDEIQQKALALRLRLSREIAAGTLGGGEDIDVDALADETDDMETAPPAEPGGGMLERGRVNPQTWPRPAPAESPPVAARPRARNPQTGEVVEWNGRAWVPVR